MTFHQFYWVGGQDKRDNGSTADLELKSAFKFKVRAPPMRLDQYIWHWDMFLRSVASWLKWKPRNSGILDAIGQVCARFSPLAEEQSHWMFWVYSFHEPRINFWGKQILFICCLNTVTLYASAQKIHRRKWNGKYTHRHCYASLSPSIRSSWGRISSGIQGPPLAWISIFFCIIMVRFRNSNL